MTAGAAHARRLAVVAMELRGEITPEVERRFAEELARLEKAGAPSIELYINSGGGSVISGLGIHSALSRYSGQLTTWTDAIAASMGAIVFLAGETRRVAARSYLMLHAPWLESTGSAAALRRDAAMLDRLAASLTGIVTGRTGQPDEVVAEWLGGETWFDASQALAAGLATEIEGKAARAALAAVPLARFRHLPAALARLTPEDTSTMTTAAPAAAETAGGATVTEATASLPEAVMLERGRVAEISRLCGTALARGALPSGYAEAAIASGYDVDRVRAAIVDAAAARQEREQGETRNAVRFEGGNDWSSPASLVTRMQGALASRLSNGRVACPPEAAEFRGASVVEMARGLLEARGEGRMRYASPSTVIGRVLGSTISHTTSDFSTLLQDAGERALLDSFARTRTELVRVARTNFVPDFRTVTRVRRGEAPALSEIREAGEVPYGSLGEESESYRVKSFGKRFSITRESLINDSLNAFGDFLGEMGRATAATENSEIIALLAANSGAGPTMASGLALFSAGHGNVITTGSALSVTSLGDARVVLRRQKDLQADNYLNVRPRFLVVPPELESTAISIMASENTGTAGADANPVRNMAEVLVEPRLSGTAWYLFGDAADAPVLEMAYLDGTRTGATNGGPALDTFEEAGVLGTVFRVVFDFGVGAIGFRGAVRATGAA